MDTIPLQQTSRRDAAHDPSVSVDFPAFDVEKYDIEPLPLEDRVEDVKYTDRPPWASRSASDPGTFDSPLLGSQPRRRRRFRFWNRDRSSKPRSSGGIGLRVLLLTSCAILPALMGALFYVSIGFNAPDGIYFRNGTFVRPADQGFAVNVGGRQLSSSVSPLLVSSVSSSIIGAISTLAMSLLAFHLGRLWLDASRWNRHDYLPTPYQYFLLVDLTANTTPLSLLRFVRYTIFWSSHVGATGHNQWFRGKRSHVVRILSLAFFFAFIVLAFSWSIKITDVVLHEQLKPTQMIVTTTNPTFMGDAALAAACRDPSGNDCGVINRTNVASTGGLNQSDIFQFYQADRASFPQANIAFLGPANPSNQLTIAGGRTFAADTRCQAYHPECFVQNDVIEVCGPGSEPPERLDQWNTFLWEQGFDTRGWENRLQNFMPLQGNVTYNGGALTNGANMNPFTTISFGCFKDFSDISYNDRDLAGKNSTPFINWWTTGAGIGNKPFILCSIQSCNTTVYSARYNLSGGVISLQNDSLEFADAATTLAISGANVFLGTPNSSWYQWAPRFLDDQLQTDLASVGNLHGNDTAAFADGWGQALSNRLVGWSVGAIELAPTSANFSAPVIALAMPLATVHLFASLHFLYFVVICLLGLSCLFIPTRPLPSEPVDPAIGGTKDELWDGVGADKPASEVALAQARLADPSTLVRELVLRSTGSDASDPSSQPQAPQVYQRPTARRNASSGSLSLREMDVGEGNEVRVGLQRKVDGNLRLTFDQEH